MTILLAYVGKRAAFLAADTTTHYVAARTFKQASDKLEVWDQKFAWATGGYSTANDEIRPLLKRNTNFQSFNKAVVEASKAVNERWRVEAAEEGIAEQSVFSLTVGFDNSGPTACANAPSLGQYRKLEPGQFIALGTQTEPLQALAVQKANALPNRGTFQADLWAIETVRAAVELFPVQIGFPIDIAVVRRGAPPLVKRIDSAAGYRADASFRI